MTIYRKLTLKYFFFFGDDGGGTVKREFIASVCYLEEVRANLL